MKNDVSEHVFGCKQELVSFTRIRPNLYLKTSDIPKDMYFCDWVTSYKASQCPKNKHVFYLSGKYANKSERYLQEVFESCANHDVPHEYMKWMLCHIYTLQKGCMRVFPRKELCIFCEY